MSQIICKNLTLGYENKKVVGTLDFTVERGDYLAVVGENGSGKTTLMKTVLGLMPPLGGSITFGDGLKRTEIGYLPQQTEHQKDFPATVKEVVLSGTLSGLGLKPFYGEKEKTAALKNIKKMGLEGYENKPFANLSGGQKQRVLLARALCAAKSILLLDEPASGLDEQATNEMYSIIESLNASGVTIVMITHDHTAALKYADHILHVGHDVFFGTKSQYQDYLQAKNEVNGGQKDGSL